MSKLDPTIETDLNAIEAALAAGAPTSDEAGERELQELALLLESDAARPDPEFAAELGELVRDGFPRERRSPLRGLRDFVFRRPLPIAAGALSLVLAGGVLISLSDDGGEDGAPHGAPLSRSAPSGGPIPPPEQAAPGARVLRGSVADEALAPVPPIPGGERFAPGRRQRFIERSAALTMAAPGDELDRVAERIAAVTDRYDGFVLSSQVTSGDDGTAGGSFDLRIPADRLQPALRDLAALAEVRSRTQSGQDVTRAVVGAADRLEAARAERKSLLRRLENADSDEEAEALRRQLDLNASEIRSLRSQLRALRLSTGYAAVTVSLVEDGEDGGGVGSGGSGKIDDAVDDALDSLVASLGIALRVLGVAIPLGLIAGAMWGTARLLRRRRREAALG